MQKDLQKTDWSDTPLGPQKKWPENLQSYVNICFSSNDPSCICWGDDLITVCNEEWRYILGNTHPSFSGQPAREFFEDNWSFFENNFQEVLSTSEVREANKNLFSRPDGEERSFTFSFNPIWNEQREICGIFITAQTKKKLVKREEKADFFRNTQFKQQKRLYEAIISSTPDLVYVFDLNYRFIFANDALLEMWGLTREEYWGKTLREIGYEEWHAEMHEREIDQVIATKQPVQGEVTFPHDQLGERYYDYIFVPVIDENGNVEAVAGTTRDITARKQAEQALRKNRDRLRTALEIETVGVVFWGGKNFTISEVNDAFLDMCGYSHKEIMGKSWRELTPEGHYSVSEQGVTDLKERGYTEPYEKQYLRKDGSCWWGLSAPRKIDDNEVVEFVLDITERKEAAEKLEEMNKTLEKRVEERTKKLRSLASQLNKAEERERQRLATELHDQLGQMLTVAKMKVDSLQHGQLFDQPNSDVEELKEVVNDALKFNQNLMVELKPPPVLNKDDITEVLRWTAKRLEKKGLDVTINDDGQPKPVDKEIHTVLCQSVRELLRNVLKHADTDEAQLNMRRENAQLMVSVEDFGKGFDMADDGPAPTEDKKYGLFNIQERMNWHGGSFEIRTAPGEGTKAILCVPLKQEESLMLTEDKDLKVFPPHRGDGQRELWQEVKVLLVDDHDMVRRGLRQMIDKQDDMTIVAEASNGQEAVESALETFPDVVVMDVNMPIMDGIESTQKIKVEIPNIRIIGLSLHDSPEVIQDMKNAGASAYLTKDEAFETLCETIRSQAAEL